MLTKKDEQRILGLFEKELHAALSRMEKKLDILNANIATKDQLHGIIKKLDEYHATNINELKAIRERLDEFISIMKHFAKEQKILRKKMQEIEAYFDPQTKN